MPFYDYECDKCDLIFESLEKLDTDVISCLACGALAGRILINPPTFKFATKDREGKWIGDSQAILRKMAKDKLKKKKQVYTSRGKKK